jgi:hypothetical protein
MLCRSAINQPGTHTRAVPVRESTRSVWSVLSRMISIECITGDAGMSDIQLAGGMKVRMET